MLRQIPSLILPMGVEEKGESEDSTDWVTKEAYLYDELPKEARGVVNLNIGSLYGVVRTFRPYYETKQGRVSNFATALAQIAAPETVEELQEVMEHQDRKPIYINYDAREYETVNPSEVLEHPEMLMNRIVLVGMLNDPQDLHITPIGEYTPGLLVHAHALSTIMNGEYLTPIPQWAQWALGLFLCLCFVLMRVFLADYRAGSFLMRIFQMLMLLLVVVMGTLLFVHYRLIVELSLPLSLIALAFLAMDVWKGILGFFKIKNL
jgi:CHASE2 domain-containing sensor protein